MKIKMVFDSSVGYKESTVKGWGAGFVPLVITIDAKEYKDGIDLDQDDLVSMMNKDTEIATAAAALGDLEKAFEEALEEAEHVVYISLTKELSSSNNNAKIVANEPKFEGKVTVIESEYITPWTYLYATDIVRKAKEGNLENLINYIDELQKDVIGFLIPETMLFLKKGGRVSKAQYILGSLAKVNPVIFAYKGSINDEKHGLKPLKGKGPISATEKGWKFIMDNKDKFLDSNYEYQVFYMGSGTQSKEFKDLVWTLAEENGYDTHEIKDTKLGGAIVAHTGPEMYLMGLRKILK